MPLTYISRAALFPTQREWFDAAAKRKAICRCLSNISFLELLALRRHIILRELFKQHCELVAEWAYKKLQEAKAERSIDWDEWAALWAKA